MTDLTEQWKKGELPEGHYYIKTRSETNIDEYIQWYKDHGIPSEKSFAYFNVQQVLAPVPSYEEWEKLNWYAGNGVEENQELKMENKKLKDILYNISYQTPALGGNKKDMERALLDIDYLCDLALRPDEIKELEK